MLGANGLRRILQSHGLLGPGIDDEDDDDDEYGVQMHYGFGFGRRRRRRQGPPEEVYPKVPSEVGRELMMSGHYGNNPDYVDDLKKRKKRLATKLMWRELGIEPGRAQRRTTQSIFQVGCLTSHAKGSTLTSSVGHDPGNRHRQDHTLRFAVLFRTVF